MPNIPASSGRGLPRPFQGAACGRIMRGRMGLQTVLVFLLAVVVGRLALERTGIGLVLLWLAVPLVGVVLAAMYGRAGFVLALVFAATALSARILFANVDAAWALLLLVPVVVVTLLMATHVARTMWRERKGREREEDA